MIQRIQTLYLLVVTALMAVTLFCPLVLIAVDGTEVTLSAFSISTAEGVLSHASAWLGALLALSTLIPAVTIFLFKNRPLQIRLCGALCVLLVGSLALIGTFTYSVVNNILGEYTIGWSNIAFRLPVIMPLISVIITPIAMRAILKDEILVKSLDRIR